MKKNSAIPAFNDGESSSDSVRSQILVVIGVAGVGKTTLGHALAGALNARFLDADDFHPPANVEKMRSGVALTDADRDPWLTALNSELIAANLRGSRIVLACSALKQRYRESISQGVAGIAWIFLDGDRNAIADRLRLRANHYMPAALLESQFEALERPIDAVSISIELSTDEQVATVLFALTGQAESVSFAAQP